jgi:hypothetical protein
MTDAVGGRELPNSTFQQSPDKPFEGQDKALKASKVEELDKLAFRLAWLSRDLYLKGFNVVPVDKDKRPLLSWSWESRLEERSRLTDLKSSKTEKLSSNRLVKEEGGPGRDE